MANSNLKLKGPVRTDDDIALMLDLLQPSVTETNQTVTISPAVATRANGQIVRAYANPRVVSNFEGGSINFNTYISNVPTGMYVKAIITLDTADNLEVVFGSPASSSSAATEPLTLQYPICMVVLHNTGGVLDVITNTSFEDRRPVNQITGAPQYYASGDEIVSESYLFEMSDSFVGLPNEPDNSIDFTPGTGTSTSQYGAENIMTMQYSNRTATVTGNTSIALTSIPSFTVLPNQHWVQIGGVAARIISVTDQLHYTVASPGFTNQVGVNATISQMILTLDLYNDVGSATEGTRIVDNVSGLDEDVDINVNSIILDYSDSIIPEDPNYTAGTPNAVAYATTTTIDDTASRVQILTPTTKDGFVSEVIMPNPQQKLILFFLPNVTTGDGTVNLLSYQCFLIKDPYNYNGGVQNQAYGFTSNASGLNCLFSTLTQNEVNSPLADISATPDATLEFNNTNQQKIAQKFVFLSTGQVTSVTTNLRAVGAPAGTMTCSIYADSSGSPGTLQITSTNSITLSSLTSSFTTQTFTFSATNLGAGTYWVSFEPSAGYISAFSTANRVEIQDVSVNNSSYNQFTNKAENYNGTTWLSAAGRQFSSVSAIGNTVVGIEAITGNAYAWGLGSTGAIGNNAASDASSPTSVYAGRSYAAVEAGGNFVVAIESSTGNAYAWGLGTSGQLGNNAIVSTSSPVSVVGGRSFKTIVSSSQMTVAIEASTGNLYTWGIGTSGQLGNNSNVNQSSPVSVVGGRSYTSVTMGPSGNFVVALDGSGYAWAWGLGTNGVLGNNTASSASSPVSVVGGRIWSSVMASDNFVVALQSGTGNAYAWGLGTSGQLGNNAIVSASSPVSVVGGRSYASVYARNGSYTIALDGSGFAWAWGINTNGNLGINTVANASSPTSVVGGRVFSTVTTNQNFAVALQSGTGNAYAWGLGTSGQLGNNTVTSASSPVSVVGGRSYTSITSRNGSYTVALDASGNGYVWGVSSNGQLGNNSIGGVNASSPVAVLGVGQPVLPYNMYGNVNVTQSLITFNGDFLSYVPNINEGTPYGDLIVLDSGVEIPRQTSGVTDNTYPYYQEYTNNSILLWGNFSATANRRQITVLRRSGTVDSSVQNGQFIADLQEAGSTVIYGAAQSGCNDGDVVYFNGTEFVQASAASATTAQAFGIINNISGSTGNVIMNGTLTEFYNIEVASIVVDEDLSGSTSNTFTGGTGAQVLIGQVFNSGLVSTIVSGVELEIWNPSASTGSIYVELWATAGGLPAGGAPLISSALVNVNTLPTTDPGSPTVSISFAGTKTLTANTQYAIVIAASAQLTGSGINWKQDTTGGFTHGNSVISTDGGSIFTVSSYDYCFQINGVPAAAVSLLPGNTYYLSQDTPGKIVTPEPLTGVQMRIGYAISSTQLILDIASQNVLTTADAIVGSAFQVSVGIAGYTTLQAAHDAVSSGSKILVLPGTYSGTTNISKQLFIEGRGYASQLTGQINFNSGATDTYVHALRFANNITVQAAVSSLIIQGCWLATGMSYTDSGTNLDRNQVSLMEE